MRTKRGYSNRGWQLRNYAPLFGALRELHRVCAAMDLDNELDRPSEDEYQAAMRDARKVLDAVEKGPA